MYRKKFESARSKTQTKQQNNKTSNKHERPQNKPNNFIGKNIVAIFMFQSYNISSVLKR